MNENFLPKPFASSASEASIPEHKNLTYPNSGHLGPTSYPSQSIPYPQYSDAYRTQVPHQNIDDDQVIDPLIKGISKMAMGHSSGMSEKSLIFSATFSDAETLKQLFGFLSVDSYPFKITNDSISIFKTKKNDIDSTTPVMILNIKIDCDQLLKYEFNPEKVSHPSEEFHGFNIESSHLNSMIKNAKTNSVVTISQYESDSFLTCHLFINQSIAKNTIAVTEYMPEKCSFKSNIGNDDLKPNYKIILNDFTNHCASLTRIKKIYATIHFNVYAEGLTVISENREAQSREWGYCEGGSFHFIFSPILIKNLGGMKKFNNRSIVKFFAVDNSTLRVDTDLSSFGYVNLYLINQST